jgi:NAD(P)H-hydrate epimerase
VPFQTEGANPVPAVTAAQMREVDRIAVEEFGLSILQMMENAGRNLAQHAMDMLNGARGTITVLAGSGGNGGGGLCCARHLHNHGIKVQVVLSKKTAMLTGAARNQLRILQAVGVDPVGPDQAKADIADSGRTSVYPSEAVRRSQVVVDALIGYSLRGAPRGPVAELIDVCNRHAARVLSLDVPSGLNATTGEAPGRIVRPERTLTLALPKTGLDHVTGEIYLADIGIPPEVFQQLGLSYEPPFGERYWIRLET